jgi:hypothetical protein
MTTIYYYAEIKPKGIEKHMCTELESKYDWPPLADSWTESWMQQEIAEDYYDACGGDWTTGTQEFTVYDENMNKLMEFTAEIDYSPTFYTWKKDEQ